MKNAYIKGAFILSAAGILTRFIGFYNRIFLAEAIGAEGVGLYQMIFPLYGLCISFAVSGIETAISKYVAEYNTEESDRAKLRFFCSGLLISLLLSLFVSSLLFSFRRTIAVVFLGDARCEHLLSYAAAAVPICAIHGCIMGYFMGQNQMHVPAFAQLLEQAVRVGSLFFFVQLTRPSHYASPVLAMLALVLGETASTLLCIFFFLQEKKKLRTHPNISSTSKKESNLQAVRKILSLGIPLSGGRMISSFILSFEAVLILKGLKSYGISHTEAVAIYGIFNGMALPFILFPSTFTTAVSSVLLPSVSKASSQNDHASIQKTTTLVVRYCFSIGLFFSALFYFFGESIGLTFFSNSEAGLYIHILSWICPFLYLGTTLNSILNGLGKAGVTFFISVGTSIFRVGILYALVAHFGIRGYLWNILLSQVINTLLLLFYVKKETAFSYSLRDCLFLPALFTVISIGLGLSMQSFCHLYPIPLFFELCFSAGTAFFAYMLFHFFSKPG